MSPSLYLRSCRQNIELNDCCYCLVSLIIVVIALLGLINQNLLSILRHRENLSLVAFQAKWFNQFLWLEYSPMTNRAYCFYCYLFRNDGNSSNCSALVISGYNQWKRLNDGSKCMFLTHLRSLDHNICERRAENLMKPSQHIDKVMHTISNEEVEKRCLRLKSSIRSARWLAFQRRSFRGHDESESSLNHGNFLEMIKILAETNTEIDKVVMKNAPKNAQDIASSIQKEILHIMANRVRRMIHAEIGDGYFCILVDEA
ncbi:zinc finger MYM-type protein 1-like [Olea europaea var. sylvestris]|uniref:zinc finger MYM-type protein 1-like n=1 Tax=Olea europaea var. sylvestris TaxID=158386 RepID=UPI000C1CF3D5|nr:zinc finger MYM-type protein 1-like [Olea europaea var. sylvestris]